jgi:hypothetical protein
MRKLLLLLTLLLLLLSQPGATAFSQKAEEYLAYLPLITVEDEVFNYLPVVLNNNPVPQPPGFMYSTSYYMSTVDPTILYNFGCQLGLRDLNTDGVQDSVVIIDFGSPTYKDGTYGATLLISYNHTNTTALGNAIKAYGKGYYDCSDYFSQLTIGIGTTNYDLGAARYGSVTPGHARAWAAMVNDVNAYFVQQGYSGQVHAVGANDMELGWNDTNATRDIMTINWVNAYDEGNLYPLYDFGDAQGCPTRLQPGWQCQSPYSQNDLWYIAYGAPPSYPLPLVYATYGVNARQWAYLSYWAHNNKGQHMEIVGSMTQWVACQQAGPGACNETDADPDNDLNNTPQQGYQLQFEVNYWPQTSQVIRWATDIMWQDP